MPKALSYTSLVIAVFMILLFALDLIPWAFAPFQNASMIMDIVFLICGIVLAYLSWTTLKEHS